MIVKRFFEPLLAHSSYLIGCAEAHQAIVIDPHRDIDTYIAAADAEHLQITYVTETHIHADYLSGSRELAHRTGAELLLSDEGDANWKYAFAREGRLVRAGDQVCIGNVKVQVLHTPGHTPEHLTFLITDGAAADAPIAAVTGDFIFVGDVGRPDLLERAANFKGTMEAGARTLYRSLQAFNYDEWLQIWPGHGAGSACGKGISAVPHSTLGYEHRFNWAFKVKSEDEFVAQVLAGQPDPPRYFATMKRLNKEGPALLHGFHVPRRMDDAALESIVATPSVVVDARPASEFADGFLPGTINLPLNSSFVTWAGWLIPYDADLYVIVPEGGEARLRELVRALALIGLDRVKGYFAAGAISRVPADRLSRIRQIAPAELSAMRGDQAPVVIDVRNDNEWHAGHLPSAVHIPLGRLTERLNELPKGHSLVVQCAAGTRSAIAASVLARAGVANVSNLAGGYDAWVDGGYPTTAPDTPTLETAPAAAARS
jgi:hydroxyacylglutathione hydrolase